MLDVHLIPGRVNPVESGPRPLLLSRSLAWLGCMLSNSDGRRGLERFPFCQLLFEVIMADTKSRPSFLLLMLLWFSLHFPCGQMTLVISPKPGSELEGLSEVFHAYFSTRTGLSPVVVNSHSTFTLGWVCSKNVMCVDNEFSGPPCLTRWVPDHFPFTFEGRKD